MIIKKATISDVLLLMPVLTEYFNEFNDNGFNYNKTDSINFLSKVINSKDGIVFICCENNQIIGISGIFVSGTFFCLNDLQGYEFIWHSNKNLGNIKRYKVQIALLKEMEIFCKNKNITLRIGTKPTNTLKKYLEKKGYKMSEITLVRSF